jgi:hypothetical protein
MKKFSCDPNKQYFDLEKKENTMFSIFVQNFIQEIQNSMLQEKEKIIQQQQKINFHS